MRYELLLQPPGPDIAHEPTKVEQALQVHGLVERPGGLAWALGAGEVEVRPLVEAGVQRATVLRVPLSDRLELVREAVVEASVVAKQTGTVVYDPQLGRLVSGSDEAAVAEHFLRTARYAGEMMGLPEALGASFAPPAEGLKAGTRVLLGLVALGAIAFLLLDLLLLG